MVDILIWERGAGWTLASGSSSGAVACAARSGTGSATMASSRSGCRAASYRIDVRPDWSIRLQGGVEEVYTGTFSRDFMRALGQ
jgi:diaminopimelate epimerase